MADLSPTQFAEQIKAIGTQILDVRTPAEFAEGHLANAINIDFYSESFDQHLSQLDKNKNYALYCRSGQRSGMAAEQMKQMGFSNVCNLSGGILDWIATGLAIIK